MSRHASPLHATPSAGDHASSSPTLRTRGEPLPAPVRTLMEGRYGHDFSQVRVHAGDDAASAARSLHAQAYTVGRDVVFGAGRYAPSSAAGQSLLAHELAHVVQQSRGGDGGGDGMGAEARADDAAEHVMQGRRVDPHRVGGAPVGVQMKPGDDAPLLPPPMLSSMTQTLASVDVEPGDSLGKDSPKLRQIADSYRAYAGLGSAARVRLSADLPESVRYDTAQERVKRAEAGERMRAVRDALQGLGVPSDAIDIRPATAYSTSAHGQVSASVSKLGALPPLVPSLAPPGVTPLPAGGPPAPAGGGMPSLDLELKFGPVTVSLPKEARAKLPIPLQHGLKLVIELAYEVPAKFSFKITLDGTRFVKVSLGAGAEVDAKSGGVTGSAGLTIETTSTVCNAADPGETRKKISDAGDKLNKAAKDYEAASGSDKLSAAFDIASAIGEMYDAVDKAKAKCKQVPRATIEFGYKRPLAPGSDVDPNAPRPAEYIGGTVTAHF